VDEKLSFFRDLLKLANKYGQLAAELTPIVQRLISEIRAESSMTTEEIIGDTRVELAQLRELLAAQTD
jgi:malonyl CoA-acyl carrier protein transacylase